MAAHTSATVSIVLATRPGQGDTTNTPPRRPGSPGLAGLFCWGRRPRGVARRESVYHGARRAFFAGQASKRLGHANALALGRLIASRGPQGSHRVLQQVRTYRGMPVAAKDPRGHAAAWRQQEAQIADKNAQHELQKVICDEYGYVPYDVVQHCDRPLRYPSDYPRQPAQEKGVDVQLAVDFVSGAFAGRFDVGVIMSTDTDLYPALEAVRRHGIDRAWPFALPPPR